MSSGLEQTMGRRDFLRWSGVAGLAAGGSAFMAGSLLAAPAAAAATSLPDRAGPTDGYEPAGVAVARPANEHPDGVLRLDANENPYGPSPACRRAIERSMVDANRYPIAERKDLIDALARKHGLDRERILPGCGSTELLRTAVSAFAATGSIVLAHPTYEDPVEYSKPHGSEIIRVSLDREGRHDLLAMERAISKRTRMVYVCNPNNPTGTLVGGKILEDFTRRVSKRAIVIIDEAYHDYVEDPAYASMVPLASEGLQVVVTRTFSKIHGLAGLRLGYALGSAKLLERMAAHLTFASASIPAIHAGLASLRDADFLEHCRGQNAVARKRLSSALVARGYPVFTSNTNFVMFRLGTNVRALIDDMESRGVRVGRPFPPLDEYCRVSLGTPEQVERFLSEFDQWRQAAAA